MSTLSELKSRVYAPLRDPSKTFVFDEEVEDWLNEAYFDLALRLELLQVETTGVFTAGALALPATLGRILSLSIAGRSRSVEFVDDAVYDSWRDAGGPPGVSLGRVWNSTVEVIPAPNNGVAYTLRYAGIPARLDSVEDTPVVNELLQTKMVRYAQWQGFTKISEPGDADRCLGVYEQGLPDPELGRARLTPGPINIAYELGPFDTSWSAAHI